jgi:hypothetical protein
MISILDEFRTVIANLPTGPVAAGPVTHPRISVYAATAVAGDIAPVQAAVAAIIGGAWEAQIAAIDADLKLYELAVEEPSSALGEAEVANLISYGMTTVEPGVDALGVASLLPNNHKNFLLAPARGRGYADLVERSETVGGVGEGECREVGAVLTPAQIPTAVPLTRPRLSACSAKTGVALSLEGEEILKDGADALIYLITHATRDISALFGAIVAARMAGIRVVLAGENALVARDLLQSLNPDAVSHCREAAPGDFDQVFGLTGVIALLQAEP